MSTVTQVKQNLRRVKDPAIRERLLMVKSACEKPLREAAKDFGCTHGKIDFWKKRFEEFGVRGLRTKQRPGRPTKITEEESIAIRHEVSKKNVLRGWRTKHVCALIHKETGVKYTQRHTIRILQKWGMARVTPRPRYAHSREEDRKAFLKKTRPTWHALKKNGAW